MSIEKKYIKKQKVCKVTFRLPKEAVVGAKKVNVVGDFNGWNFKETPMKGLMNGEFKVTVNLEANREYQFRYLLDNKIWENDWDADKYIPNGFGVENSVVVI